MRHLVWCLLLVLAWACASGPASPLAPRPDSVVALLAAAPPRPCLGLPEEPCRLAPTWEPCCTAFAVVHDQQTMLATAAHCVPGDTTSLTDLRFWAPSGWGHGHAYLLERDDARDVAFLGLVEREQVEPLKIGRLPLVGEPVSSWSPVFRETSAGRVTDWLNDAWFETTQSAVAGWSGTPVLDAAGEVVGLISQCPSALETAAKRCTPGRVVVARIEAGRKNR